MNSITLGKRVLNLALCLVTVFTLASCSSYSSREVAQEKEHKDDISKIQDGEYAPHTFHGKRNEFKNSTY